ncbi:MAG: CAP domain-containing protein [Candidatus Dojkabacteria bacterium]
MINHFIPTRENNQRAKLLSNKVLAVIAIGVLSFNLLTPVNINAQSESDKITRESLLEKHNEFRKEHNLGELRINKLLNLSAQNKADEMLRTDCWSHYCPDNRSPWEFFNDAGYDYSFAGENLAEGFYTIDKVINAWINSETHRENMLRDKYTEVGFGIVQGPYQNNENNFIVVAHFGTLKANAVFDENAKEVKITNPWNGQTIKTSYVDLTGKAFGFDKVNIFNNDKFESTEEVNEGIFTYKINNFNQGSNLIKVEGLSTSKDVGVLADLSKFTYSGDSIKSSDVQSSSAISISPSSKNLMNLIFALFLAVLFLIDFILLSRTDFAKKLKSYSHYHLAIFSIIILVIVVGGIAGNVGSALIN